jgi:hypothetical protein
MNDEMLYLFPTPVYASYIGRAFSEEERNIFEEYIEDSKISLGNKMSNNSYVLDDVRLSGLRDIIMDKVNLYISKQLEILDIEPYITQSWISSSTFGGFHPEHYHPNSFFTGIIYVSASSLDSTVFKRPFFTPQLQFRKNNPTINNADMWPIKAEVGKIVLFPSHLIHFVPKVFSAKRTTISFNIFAKGSFGSDYYLDHLNI